MTAPTTLRAGDSATWTETLTAYPASDGWTHKSKILWPVGTGVTLTAVGSGDDHTYTVAAGVTAAWRDGTATLLSWVERSGERVTLGATALTILPDLANLAAVDGRSAAAKALADAKAALAAYVAGGKGHVEEYEIAGRRIRFRGITEIRDLIKHYEIEVAGERALQALLQGGSPGRVLTRF